MQAARQAAPRAAAQPHLAAAPAARQQLVAAQLKPQQQQQQPRRQQRASLVAAAAGGSGRRAAAAARQDAGDEFEEMLERRDELLRIRDEAEDEGLNTDEDEELADLTERARLSRLLAAPLRLRRLLLPMARPACRRAAGLAASTLLNEQPTRRSCGWARRPCTLCCRRLPPPAVCSGPSCRYPAHGV